MIDQAAFENIKRLNQEYKDAVKEATRLAKESEDAKAHAENTERLLSNARDNVHKKLFALHDAAENISLE